MAEELDQLEGGPAPLVAVEVDAREGVPLVDGGRPVEAGNKVEAGKTNQKTRRLPPVTKLADEESSLSYRGGQLCK